MIQTKRAYDQPEAKDGLRILVDRLWPRGVTKEHLAVDQWVKELSPSDALRRWFGHEPKRWSEFISRYWQELDEKQSVWEAILIKAKRHRITLLYGAKDTQHNNAEALKLYLESKETSRPHSKGAS
jgi:uncharacterized protein YeaO (DUF488 family)